MRAKLLPLNSSGVYVEEYLHSYTPQGWRGPIHEFDFVPYISDEDFEIIRSGGIPDKPYAKKWYVVAGIKDWQEKNLTKKD